MPVYSFTNYYAPSSSFQEFLAMMLIAPLSAFR